jgi:putative Holliday junction resolvase
MAVLLACDYGRRRVGLAVSDPSESFVFPRETLQRRSLADDIEALRALCREDGVEALVVGLPLNADGSEGGMVQEARAFGDHIAAELDLPVVYWDERYTSIEADERLRERHRDPKKRRALRDREAAAIILRTYLDRI